MDLNRKKNLRIFQLFAADGGNVSGAQAKTTSAEEVVVEALLVESARQRHHWWK